MSTAQNLEELAQRAAVALADLAAIPRVIAVQEMLAEAGLGKARRILRDGLSHLAEKQLALRQAQEEERDAKAALDAALVAAEWDLDGHFLAEGNKTFLVVGYACSKDHPVDTAPCASCEPVRKAMTADERAKWKATEARKTPEVAAAATRLRSAEHDVAGYRDALVVAEKSLSAARADLDAAIAHLSALVTALPGRVA